MGQQWGNMTHRDAPRSKSTASSEIGFGAPNLPISRDATRRQG